MKMKNITVSLRLAKKLKKAGWEKETVFKWNVDITTEKYLKDNNIKRYTPSVHNRKLKNFIENCIMWKYYPAPTATELLEELRDGAIIEKRGDRYVVDLDPALLIPNQEAPTPANALAKMWIYLKELKPKPKE